MSIKNNYLHMKFKFYYTFFFLMLFAIAYMPVQSQNITLTIKNWEGIDKRVELNSLKKITFSGTNLVLNYLAGGNEDIAFSTVYKILFSSYTALNDIPEDSKSVFIYPNPSSHFISFKNVADSDNQVAVYNINGTHVMNINLSPGAEGVDVSALKRGIYLIKVDGEVLKFTKL